MPRSHRIRPERLGRHGEVLVSTNHLALLHGLYDRPDGLANSTIDLLGAATPYVRLFRPTVCDSALQKATRTLHPSWIARRRRGACMTWWLTTRGRAIVERAVPVRVLGHGVYHGLRAFTAGRIVSRNIDVVTARWDRFAAEPAAAALVEQAGAMLALWERQRYRPGLFAALERGHFKKGLAAYLCVWIMRHRSLPRGVHRLSADIHRVTMVVDFDALTDT